ncbi:MAG: sugar phosphate isomerase/epimerase, partial [Planctomycetota bacterium]
MKIGCFALIEPFSSIERQFEAVAEMGFDYADVTDTHDGASLGVEAGFTPSTSLDSHPENVRRMADDAGLSLSTFCAHASLLEPTAPARYGTAEIIKAIRLANLLDI